MNRDAFRDEIKLKLTGNLLDIELDDSTIDKILDSALREMQRYICSTELITTNFSRCIDLSTVTDASGNPIKVSSVSRIYRVDGFVENGVNGTGAVDPMYMAQWQLLAGGAGNMKNFQNYMLDYAAWNTLMQIRNTSSTDFAFKYDKASNKLYVNVASNSPQKITIEYIPRFDSPEEIFSDYWIDVLVRLAVAITKVTIGRIRSRYTQANALWTQDGAQLLEEGTTELNALRETLVANMNLFSPID